MGLQRLAEMMQGFDVHRIIEIFDARQPFGGGHTFLGEGDGAGLFVYGVIGLRLQSRHNPIELVVFVR